MATTSGAVRRERGTSWRTTRSTSPLRVDQALRARDEALAALSQPQDNDVADDALTAHGRLSISPTGVEVSARDDLDLRGAEAAHVAGQHGLVGGRAAEDEPVVVRESVWSRPGEPLRSDELTSALV